LSDKLEQKKLFIGKGTRKFCSRTLNMLQKKFRKSFSTSVGKLSCMQRIHQIRVPSNHHLADTHFKILKTFEKTLMILSIRNQVFNAMEFISCR